jgi:prepilin-type processing-associated H-X9-DG protein
MITSPDQTIMVGDGLKTQNVFIQYNQEVYSIYSHGSHPHNSGDNLVFCDGHVTWYPKEKVFFPYIPANEAIPKLWDADRSDSLPNF